MALEALHLKINVLSFLGLDLRDNSVRGYVVQMSSPGMTVVSQWNTTICRLILARLNCENHA
jgi:hypothetical protein